MNVRSGDSYFWEKAFSALKKHFVKLIALILICALIGWAAAAFFVKPKYQANASLIVNSRESDVKTITAEQLNSAEELATLYGIIIKSDTVLEAAIKDLDLNLDYETLAQKVSVSSVSNTSVMKISVKDADGAEALKILKSIVSISPKIIHDMVEAGSVKVVSEPRLQKAPVSPDKIRYTAVGAFLGAIAACVITLLLAVSEDRLYSKREVEERLGLSVMGEIPEQNLQKLKGLSSRAGHERDVILTKNVSFSLKESIRYLRMMLTRRLPKTGTKSIIVTSAVAGEGKSCVAINLALSLASDSKRVLLMECDMRKPSVCAYLGMKDPQNGMSTLLTGKSVLKDSVLSKNGIFVIPAGEIPENPTELLNSERMRMLMKLVQERFDYIILDTPPSADMADAVALSAQSNGVLFVIRQGYADTQVIESACDKLRNADATILGAVLNRCGIETASSGRRGYGYGYGSGYGYGYGVHEDRGSRG